jgi:hypothetical protein
MPTCLLPPRGPFDSTLATVSSRIDNGGVLRQEIPLNSDQQLRKTIDDLRELERKCFAARSRFAFYDCIVYRRPGTGRPYLIVHEGV